MKKSVGAILWHCIDFEDEQFRHRCCPPGNESWCKWKLDQLNGTQIYIKTINLPKWIFHYILPTFEFLSSDELLTKCLHGKTQNSNKSLNQMIWLKYPKNVFASRDILKMGVNSAVIEFNEGTTGVENVLKYFEIMLGACMFKGGDKKDKSRVKRMSAKFTPEVKLKRKKKRAEKNDI